MSRAREFDETEVLDKALQVFWQQGYEGTSLNDLLDATGLTKSSLYATFGSKEDLFHRIVERYLSKHVEFRQACALAEPTPRRIVERLLYGMADLHADRVRLRVALSQALRSHVHRKLSRSANISFVAEMNSVRSYATGSKLWQAPGRCLPAWGRPMPRGLSY